MPLSHLLHGFLKEASAQIVRMDGWSYVVLALLVMIEGPIATLLGAGAASAGLLRPEWVFVAAGSGNLAGDALWYSLGRLGKTEWLLRHGRWLGLTRPELERMESAVRAQAPKIILIAKLTLVFAIPALVATGIARVRWRRWFPVDIFAECVWSGTLVAGGYYASGYMLRLHHDVQIIVWLLSPVVVLVGLALIKRYGARWGSKSSAWQPSAPPAGQP